MKRKKSKKDASLKVKAKPNEKLKKSQKKKAKNIVDSDNDRDIASDRLPSRITPLHFSVCILL